MRVVPRHGRIRRRFGTKIGDPIAEILVAVGSPGVELSQELLGPLNLLDLLLSRSKPNLLVAELLERQVVIVGVHAFPLPLGNSPGVPCDSIARRISIPLRNGGWSPCHTGEHSASAISALKTRP